MATWSHIKINVKGKAVKAQAPTIISASRSTDIPAFYADWFFARLDKGYSAWTNPFNGIKSYVSYDRTRFIVFCICILFAPSRISCTSFFTAANHL